MAKLLDNTFQLEVNTEPENNVRGKICDFKHVTTSTC